MLFSQAVIGSLGGPTPHADCVFLTLLSRTLHCAVTSHQNKKAEIPVWVRALVHAVKLVFLLGCLHLIYIVFNTKLASSEGTGTLVKSVPLGLRLWRCLSEWHNLSQKDRAAHRVMECSSEHCGGCFAVNSDKETSCWSQKGKAWLPNSTCLEMFPVDFQIPLQSPWGFTEGQKLLVIPQKQSYIHHRVFASSRRPSCSFYQDCISFANNCLASCPPSSEGLFSGLPWLPTQHSFLVTVTHWGTWWLVPKPVVKFSRNFANPVMTW